MSSISSDNTEARRRRRRLTNAVKESLRELNGQLSVLDHQVGSRLELRDVDLGCLDLIARYGPLSPSALARRAGLHPATMTGILDRLERAGWVTRDRDPTDRRAVTLRSRRERTAELVRLYAGMSGSMDRLCAGYQEAELEVVVDFLRRTAELGRAAAEDLSADRPASAAGGDRGQPRSGALG
jgi:DNA-binding MarR family transcriptional regulator